MDDYVMDGDLVFSDQRSALKFYREQYHKKKEWVGLTDEEKVEIQMLKWWDWEDTFDLDGYTRAIETKLREKNA